MTRLPSAPVKPTSSLRYAIGMFGTSIPINMFKTYAVAFYVDSLGLPMKRFAAIMAIYALIDAFDNPIYGYLSDHTRSRWGRRKPWFVIGTPLLILSFIFFYAPPASVLEAEKSLYLYVLLMYSITGTLDSLINANYGALFPELFDEDKKRAKTNSMRQAFQLVAMAISIALTPIVRDKIGYRNTAIIYGLLALVVILYCAFGCRENPQNQELEKPRLLRTVLDLISNPKFWLFGLTNAFYAAAFSLILSTIPLYVKYVLQSGGTETTILMAAFLAFTLIGIVVWTLILRKFQLMSGWRLSLAFMCVGFIPLYFVNSLYTVMAAASIVAFGAAGALTTMDVVGAKVMDDDFRRHGVKREGMLSSAMGVLSRLNSLYIALSMTLMQQFFGYVSGDEPGPNPARAMKVLLVVFPGIAMLCSLGVSFLLRFQEDKLQVTEPEKET